MEYTDGELKALKSISIALESVQSIDGRKLKANVNELAAAIHVLQSYVKQHVLHRLDPDEWADWYEDVQ